MKHDGRDHVTQDNYELYMDWLTTNVMMPYNWLFWA